MDGYIFRRKTPYYFPQGVFYITNPSDVYNPEKRTVTINGADKWAYLDGTLYGRLSGTYQTNIDVDLYSATRELLKLSRFDDSAYNLSWEFYKLEQSLDNEYQKVTDWGLDSYLQEIKDGTVQSIFGNIDMNNRHIITWSNELRETYKDALESWGYSPDTGAIDTVFGGSARFGEDINGTGWEIAFSPILPDGTFLSKDIVYEYIRKNYKTFIYGNPRDILIEIKGKVKPLTYTKIENLYMKFKDKIDLFTKTIRDNS